MRIIAKKILLLSVLFATAAQAESTVPVPWSEFEQLYKLQLAAANPLPETPAPLYVIDSANYQLNASETGLSGVITLSGQLLRGTPEPILLFGPEIAVTAVDQIDGGTLLSDSEGYKLFVQKRDEAPTQAFSLSVTVLAPLRDDRTQAQRVRFITLPIPSAVRGVLELTVAETLQLTAMPGLPQSDGRYILTPGSVLQLRFAPAADVVSASSDVSRPVVLDAVHGLIKFAENGSTLTVLHLSVPAEAARELRVVPVAGAELWSLSVNDRARMLDQESTETWLVRLPSGPVVVELAYLQKNTKLGLSGRLAIMLPDTGLAAQQLKLAIALPERLELVALEGDLEPLRKQNKPWPQVRGFDNSRDQPYYFSQPFYRGAALEAALYYREPVATSNGQGDAS